MDAWQGVGTAGVAALVSLAVTLSIRFWESSKVAWITTGEGHDEYENGRPTGRLRATIQFHNVGDGDAFNVTTLRRNGDDFEAFEMFEKGKVGAGESLEIVMRVFPECWEQALIELHWVSSPTGRRKSSREGPHHLHDILWRIGGLPDPRTVERQRRMRRSPRK